MIYRYAFLILIATFPLFGFAQTDAELQYNSGQLVQNRVDFELPGAWTLNGMRGGTQRFNRGTTLEFLGYVQSGGERIGYQFSVEGSDENYWLPFNDRRLNNLFEHCDPNDSGHNGGVGSQGNFLANLFGGGGGASRPRAGETLPALNPSHSPNPGGWNRQCYNFIQSNGTVGGWGTEFLNAARAVDQGGSTGYDVMMADFLWQNICPGFSGFSQAKKEHFLVYFIATKAMDEASCNPTSIAWNTPNPPGVGFFMLEGQARLRRGRGSYCTGGHSSGTQRTLPRNVQFQCAVSQIMSVQYGRGIPFGSRGGYWQEANRMSGDISESILEGYDGCSG